MVEERKWSTCLFQFWNAVSTKPLLLARESHDLPIGSMLPIVKDLAYEVEILIFIMPLYRRNSIMLI